MGASIVLSCNICSALFYETTKQCHNDFHLFWQTRQIWIFCSRFDVSDKTTAFSFYEKFIISFFFIYLWVDITIAEMKNKMKFIERNCCNEKCFLKQICDIKCKFSVLDTRCFQSIKTRNELFRFTHFAGRGLFWSAKTDIGFYDKRKQFDRTTL